ncbi:MAG: amino acid ABC transporter permease [Alphaproteobacteria bacterium]|nr:amino acid ABC transporter permease [Alphaproteobacteria bacterium]MCB9929257.1 amino acid ABC transporter permease [Alphaproteobacteria bacterium]
MAGPAASGSFWNDRRFRAILVQTLVMGVLAALIAFVIANTVHNLHQRNIATGFGFLDQPAGFEIQMTLIPYSAESTHGRVYLVGLLNTLLISALGCILATLLGFLLGVLRLSGNWLLEKIIYCYVEFTRNVPLLLQIIFWYTVFLGLPHIRDSLRFADGFYLNNRGLFAPAPVLGEQFWMVGVAFVAGALAAWLVGRWAHKRQDATGQAFPTIWFGIGLVVGVPLLVYLAAGAPLDWQFAERTRFSLRGGMQIAPEFMAMLLALTLYTAAFISEIVRAGILSVNKGQREAAAALGLKQSWTMRFVIVPQALRVIIPPLASQYMNLTKNSSLGFAIGYGELMAVFGGISLNQTGQAIECMAITMATYLVISLAISGFMNWYNARVRLVER